MNDRRAMMTGRRLGMTYLALTLLAASANAAPDTSVSYGPEKRMSGVYFTNFENSVFTECSNKRDCEGWDSKDGSWARCLPQACRDLNDRVSRLNGSPDRWGTFSITFIGKRSIARRPKRFLNDRESDVLIERILVLRPFREKVGVRTPGDRRTGR
jgi:hypothetical protein